MNDFLKAYIVAALWSSTDNSDESGGEPLDQNYDERDLTPRALAQMTEDCTDFCAANADDLLLAEKLYKELSECNTTERCGHDFWLTRNGHGAGFWDRGLGEVGTRLSAAAKIYGSIDLYVTDDDKIDCQ